MGESDFLYNKVIEYIEDIIRKHPNEANYRLPSEKQLQLKLGVSSITVKTALKKLVERDLIIRRQGQGSFVKAAVPEKPEPDKPRGYNVLVSFNSIGSHYINQIILGLQETFREKNVSFCFVANFNNKNAEEDILKSLPESNYDGLIIFPVDGNYYNRNLFNSVLERCPVVIIDREYKGVSASFVTSDHYGVTYRTVCGLIDEGIENIAIILPLSYNISSVLDRYRGYIDAFTRKGVPIKRHHILNRYYDNEEYDFPNASAYPCPPQTIEQWTNDYMDFLLANPDIQAIITINGISFFACINAARKLKKMSGKTYKIFVYDDDNAELASITDVEFTALRQQGYEIGKQAAAQLYGLITNTSVIKKIVIDFCK